ncbi:hypothetical protein Pint_05971 [Pistacia integerrima]|uniref:Uncharacterized protein n=1 Tax=Pistacia integerrima TaxID=434235 RepID=A0ACC0Z934_9ROSI|nr:hypothetical protein Pint_05971 [Pistacia integerrima]
MSGRDMAGKDENRIFVGGLSWDVNERQLENAFSRFGKIIEAQFMIGIQSHIRGLATFALERVLIHGRHFAWTLVILLITFIHLDCVTNELKSLKCLVSNDDNALVNLENVICFSRMEENLSLQVAFQLFSS